LYVGNSHRYLGIKHTMLAKTIRGYEAAGILTLINYLTDDNGYCSIATNATGVEASFIHRHQYTA